MENSSGYAQYNDDDDDDADDDENDDDTEGSDEVQLGFIQKSSHCKTASNLFDNADWTKWDGGKVGGTPVWLDPIHIPSSSSLKCSHCQDPLSFLLQIYCPIDALEEAFHRALYVFCCRKKRCIDLGSVKCLRTQLPRRNPFYAYDPAVDDDDLISKMTTDDPIPSLCHLCGCRASNVCASCKGVFYCSRLHQKEDWSTHKLLCKGKGKGDPSSLSTDRSSKLSDAQIKYLFPNYGIVVENENLQSDHNNNIDTPTSTHIWEDAMTEGSPDEADDLKLTQSDYHKALQGDNAEKHDPTYINFITRISRGGSDQVLRYCRSSTADRSVVSIDTALPKDKLLYLSSDRALRDHRTDLLRSSPCERCGSPRIAECQIMPQLLHYLNVDKNTTLSTTTTAGGPADASVQQQGGSGETSSKVFVNKSDKDIDWGSLDIFTCSASCSHPEPSPLDTNEPSSSSSFSSSPPWYLEELVMIQPAVYRNHCSR